MLTESVVFFLFRLFNLLILLSIATYIMYRFVLGPIRKKIAERKTFFDQLRAQERELKYKSIELKRITAEQNALCEHLKKQVVRWNQSFTDRLQQQAQEREQQLEVIKQRLKVQNYTYIRSQLEHTVIPGVFTHAEQTLHTAFSDAQKNKEYVGKIIQKMEVATSVAALQEPVA